MASPLKRKASAGPICFDLTSDDGGDTTSSPVATPSKRPRLAGSSPASTPDQTITPAPKRAPATSTPVRLPHRGTPTPQRDTPMADTPSAETSAPTPQKERALYDIPEIAERYVPQLSDADVLLRDPQTFALKPAFWRRWKGPRYALFAEYLRLHFDPVPFAQKTGLPVEEVNHVFSTLVCNPLYDAKEAGKRGEEGMQEIFEMYRERGAVSRGWGKTDAKQLGELGGVEAGKVQLILEDGSKASMEAEELSEVDVKYLRQTLTKEDRRMVFGEG
ncbi:hypothetical protein LTR09_000411 [Extremus antarcticus]|uniref:Uncharacterized protein n=1 Tax=Extremus antarcticus TaxID=702011 RepID=A0AAJ0LXE1_9PEZI|nr:hypothetical protein LTR09_000411 [Extremus antarcticus]